MVNGCTKYEQGHLIIFCCRAVTRSGPDHESVRTHNQLRLLNSRAMKQSKYISICRVLRPCNIREREAIYVNMAVISSLVFYVFTLVVKDGTRLGSSGPWYEFSASPACHNWAKWLAMSFQLLMILVVVRTKALCQVRPWRHNAIP